MKSQAEGLSEVSQRVPVTIVRDIDSKMGQIPGAVEYTTNKRGHYDGIFYRCPCGCGKSRFLSLSGKKPWWNWDGNLQKPTLDPSVIDDADGVTHWHGWLMSGVWVRA